MHRDLKLENLLLDRNRNIIITDFGFANRFEDREDDLMATSCGSPCYAAPELVVQDGKYVGSAVDVWSCGVILYAMLAGYLPFDDDPLNPDSENINLLYKYILNTPLAFPEWVSKDARDLLHKILVPDPLKRCTLQDIAKHPWLRKYASLFDRTVEDLEQLAAEGDEQKRFMLEKQREAILYHEQAASANMSRSQSSTTATRHQSAMVTSSTNQQLSISANGLMLPPPGSRPSAHVVPSREASSSSKRAHAQSAIVVPTLASPDPTEILADVTAASTSSDPFARHSNVSPILESAPMMVSVSAPGESAAAPAESRDVEMTDAKLSTHAVSPLAQSTDQPDAEAAAAKEAARKRKAQANRYTVQVEYDPAATERANAQRAASGASTRSATRRKIDHVPNEPTSNEAGSHEVIETPSLAKPVLPPPTVKTDSPVLAEPSPARSDFDRADSLASSAIADAGHSVINLRPKERSTPSPTPKEGQSPAQLTPRSNIRPKTAQAALPVPFPSPERTPKSSILVPEPAQPSPAASSSSEQPTNVVRPDSAASTRPSHKKNGSSDRFSISRLLGASTSSVDKTSRIPSSGSHQQLADKPQPEVDQTLDEVTNKRKGARRKALSMVVEPFKSSTTANSTSTKAKRSSVRIQAQQAAATAKAEEQSRARSATLAAQARPSTPVVNVTPATRASPRKKVVAARPAGSNYDASWGSGQAPPGGKAKRVMDWFRWRSMPRDAVSSENRPGPPPTEFDRTPINLGSKAAAAEAAGPKVVVTGAPQPLKTSTADVDSLPSSRSASGQQSVETTSSQATAQQSMPAPVPSVSAVPQRLQREGSVVSVQEPFSETKLRFHQGAVDQASLTSRSPPDVLQDVRKALWAMGIDVREEAGPFRLKCTRRSKKLATAHGHTAQQSLSGHGAANSEKLDGRTGLPMPGGLTASPSSTFRNFFGRRSSSASAHGLGTAGQPSPSLTISTSSHYFDSPDLLMSPLAQSTSSMTGQQGTLPMPFIGSNDGGSEVRFTVELTRMKNLPKLYAVDIRRLKGELWAYRSIYHALFSRLE